MLFSVVTIVRNDRAGIQRTMRSVRSQDFQKYEYILIDGASTDGTLQYINENCGAGTIVSSAPDKGIYDAMNKGLSLASGKYILFMNAGDTFADADTLTKVSQHLGDADVVYGDAIEILDGIEFKKKSRGIENINSGMFANHQSIYYKIDFARKFNILYELKYKIAADYAFTCRFIASGATSKYFSEWLCKFDMQGASNKNKKLGREENWRIQREILGVKLHQRILNRCRYVAAALLSAWIPGIYARGRYAQRN